MLLKKRHLMRASVAFLHDVTMAALSFVIAIVLRMGHEGWPVLLGELLPSAALFTLVCAAVFLWMRLYRGIWRYASLNDLEQIVRAVTLALLIFLPVTFLLTRLEALPRTFLVINWFVLITLLAGPRLLYQLFKYRSTVHLLERDAHMRTPVLLIGAGDPAETFIRAMTRDRNAAYEVVGVIDEKGGRVGRRIHQIPVLGDLDALPQVFSQITNKQGRRPQRIILTKELSRERLTSLLRFCEQEGLSLARLPRLTDFRSGNPDAFAPMPIAIEDLLRRPQTSLDTAPPQRLVAGRRVLVTGAGGTIGAELVRQLAELAPAEIVLFDSSEYLLYSIDLELSELKPTQPRRSILGDVRDATSIDAVMRETRPELVFHAAALKHVPLVEAQPEEGILINVLGTRIVADACRRHEVGAMVLISSDKAVNPGSIMGATKRLAESYCQALDIAARKPGQASATRFVTVRFGNVLGSTGSVVPLFQRQLAQGGPLTVTHPEVSRYFMTTREAVHLVLQAAALGVGPRAADAGMIYVLDMGQPVKIVELAEQMIRLAGKRPHEDVEIVFTGLRPGEKLTETLFHDSEPLDATGQPGLLLASPRSRNVELLSRGLDELAEAALARRQQELLSLLQRLVPEFEGSAGGPRKDANSVAAS